MPSLWCNKRKATDLRPTPALKDFIAKDSNGGAFQIAVLYAIRKEPDEMFKWLDTAYATRDSGLTQLAVTPFFPPLSRTIRASPHCARSLTCECRQARRSHERAAIFSPN